MKREARTDLISHPPIKESLGSVLIHMINHTELTVPGCHGSRESLSRLGATPQPVRACLRHSEIKEQSVFLCTPTSLSGVLLPATETEKR